MIFAEEPTSELRQMRHSTYFEAAGITLGDGRPYYTIQRKWRVSKQEEYELGHKYYPYRGMVYVVEEWRDLPIVSAEEAAKP